MSAGELSEPGGKDAVYTPGFVTSYNDFHPDGSFKVYPAINANKLKRGDLVTFEIDQASYQYQGDTISIPVAIIDTVKRRNSNKLEGRVGQTQKTNEAWNQIWGSLDEGKIDSANGPTTKKEFLRAQV